MFKKRGDYDTIEEVVKSNIPCEYRKFLNMDEFPYINNLRDAAKEIKAFCSQSDKVAIVGDYDADGITSTTILYWVFKKMGIEPYIRIPKRFSEGYGINEKIIDEIEEGLLITVDNGIAAFDAIKKAKEKGLYVIILDHHLVPVNEDGEYVLPNADIIVNPAIEKESSFHNYCGAAIAWRLAVTMFPDLRFNSLKQLASIATVTDVMPLIGANRELVKSGLEYANKKTLVPGMAVLLETLNLKPPINEENYGFLLGPVFNAAERLYDGGASIAVNLLTTKRNDPNAEKLAQKLVSINKERKEIVSEIMSDIKQLKDLKRPIVLYREKCNEGIIGLIAGRLCEEYQCPVIVFTDSQSEPDVLKGSGRSIPEVHLKEVLDNIQENIVQYGGHAGAAGLSIKKEKLDDFTKAFTAECGEIPDINNDIEYDLELDISKLENVITELKKFAPFGEGNPKPLFHLKYKPDGQYKTIGDGTHFLITDSRITFLGFGLTEEYKKLGSPETLDVIGTPVESYFNGIKSYKFEIKAIQ